MIIEVVKPLQLLIYLRPLDKRRRPCDCRFLASLGAGEISQVMTQGRALGRGSFLF